MKKYLELIVKGAGAALLIGLGDYVLLKVGEPVGPVLFSFGLLGVCRFGRHRIARWRRVRSDRGRFLHRRWR